MDEFIKQDIFFAVTTAAVVVLTVFWIVLVIYLIKIARKINYIGTKTKEEVDLLSAELAQLRGNIRSSGFKLSHIGKFIMGLARRSRK